MKWRSKCILNTKQKNKKQWNRNEKEEMLKPKMNLGGHDRFGILNNENTHQDMFTKTSLMNHFKYPRMYISSVGDVSYKKKLKKIECPCEKKYVNLFFFFKKIANWNDFEIFLE